MAPHDHAGVYEPADATILKNDDIGITVCSQADSRLSDSRTPTAHTHGNLTNDGKIGSVPGLPLITGTAGAVQTSDFGAAAGTFCQGNDARLSDTRDPKAHTHTASNISDSTTAGRALLTAADAAAQRTALGLGTAATTASTAYATADQGAKADSAVQSNTTGIIGADAVTNIVSLLQAEYDAIDSPSASTLYIITDA